VNQEDAHICPVGREQNAAPYWQTYQSTVFFEWHHHRQTITINTLISWRGGWFIVHLIGYG
jgi:hypothetical protein